MPISIIRFFGLRSQNYPSDPDTYALLEGVGLCLWALCLAYTVNTLVHYADCKLKQ